MGTHLQCGDNLVAIVLGGDGIPHHAVWVDDRVPLLPADNDGSLTPRCTVELLRVAFDGDGGVGVRGDHGWYWRGEKAQEAPVKEGRQAGGGACAHADASTSHCPSPQNTSAPGGGSSKG